MDISKHLAYCEKISSINAFDVVWRGRDQYVKKRDIYDNDGDFYKDGTMGKGDSRRFAKCE